MVMIQFVSHVRPSSGENACSQRAAVSVMPDQTKRTTMGRPSSSSRPSNTPTPFAKEPTTGGSSVPYWLLAQ